MQYYTVINQRTVYKFCEDNAHRVSSTKDIVFKAKTKHVNNGKQTRSVDTSSEIDSTIAMSYET